MRSNLAIIELTTLFVCKTMCLQFFLFMYKFIYVDQLIRLNGSAFNMFLNCEECYIIQISDYEGLAFFSM